MGFITGLTGASVSVLFMTPKESDFIKSYTIIPFTGHYKYFFDDVREGVYVGMHLGFAIATLKFKDLGGFGYQDSDSKGLFVLAPTAGYVINERIDIGLRYQMMFSLEEAERDMDGNKMKNKPSNFFGARLAYNF